MVKVKICGITNLEDAQQAVNSGCDALGFVFYRKSPRYIRPVKAKEIIEQLPKSVIKIGVFVNSNEKAIKTIAKFCKLDALQFHGKESPDFCAKFKGYKIIKAFRVKHKVNTAALLKYKPFAYLFDTFVESRSGGTGKKFDWRMIRHVDGLKRPVFLSGGLTARNIKDAIKTVNPQWVDVSTSLEAAPGKKDHKKVRQFIKNAKES